MTTNDADVLALAEELRALAEGATPGPWTRCFHLQSAENDASCPCGYRGGIWSGDGSLIVCEMGGDSGGEGIGPPAPRAERSAELANAALICFIRNNAERIARALSRPVPEGFVLVPKEPTEEMLEAVGRRTPNGKQLIRLEYRAMIALCPKHGPYMDDACAYCGFPNNAASAPDPDAELAGLTARVAELEASLAEAKAANKDAYGDGYLARDVEALSQMQAAERLRSAATNLYMAGCWTCKTVPGDEQRILWEGLRDAAGIPNGTATSAGVSDK
jgi:hypothetical protein